jgi:L-threonylcarbamoyladenylate synthase
MLVEGRREARGDCRGVPILDVPPFHDEQQLAVLEDSDRGGRGRIGRKVLTRAIGRFHIATGKHGRRHIGPPRMLQRQGNARPRLPCGASADGVDHDHHRALTLHGIVHLFGCSKFCDAEARQLGTHRCDKRFGIRHESIVPDPGRPRGASSCIEGTMPRVTEVLILDARQPDPRGIARAANILRAGGLVAFPTETVYGLGAHALDPDAVIRVFSAKGRPAEDPLIVHVHHVDALAALTTSVPDTAAALASRFWPGPLTMVLPRSTVVPRVVTAGLDTVAIRVPAHPIAHALITAAAMPVAAPSANLFSRPSPTRADHVLQDLDGRIDLVIDGGPTTVGVESTVIDLTGPVPTILRPGAVTLEMIRTILPEARLEERALGQPEGGMKSPGLLTRHYSPRAPLTLYEGSSARVLARMIADAAEAIAGGRRVGIVAADEDDLMHPAALVVRIGHEQEPAALAANLYNALRTLDSAGVDVIFARTFPDGSGLAVAVHDRLRRAAAGQVVKV